MKRVFSGINLADTTHLQNLLEQSGIGTFIKNTYLGAAAGDLPVFDVSPEIWVFRDADAAHAEAVIRDALRPQLAATTQPWRCPTCDETNEHQFAACWRCGASDTRS
jgi:Putative prokaryotic signal transducing protein